MTDGKISVLVSYTGMPVYETAVALCDTVDCPVAPGPVTVKYGTTLPGVAPPVRALRYSDTVMQRAVFCPTPQT